MLLRLKTGTSCHMRGAGDLRTVVAGLDRCTPALFGRDENARTVAFPEVKFVGGRGWVGLLAEHGSAELVLEHAGAIIQAVAKCVGRPVPVVFEQHEHRLRHDHSPHLYRALNVAFKRRSPAARTANIEALARERIATSIIRHAAHLGMDTPSAEELEVACVQIDRTVGMRLNTSSGPTNEWVTVVPSLSFSAFVDLKGFWFIGSLSSRGHGRVVRQSVLGLTSDGPAVAMVEDAAHNRSDAARREEAA